MFQNLNENSNQSNAEPSTSNGNGNNTIPPHSLHVSMEEILYGEVRSEIYPQESAAQEAPSTSTTEKRSNREKFDSGLGEEVVEVPSNHSSERSDSENQIEVESYEESMDEIDEEERGSKRGSNNETPGAKWRKVTLSPNGAVSGSSTENDTAQEERNSDLDGIRVIQSPYSAHMKRKIQELPLPSILKNYLNYYREF